jgi:hypothetical protein
MIQLLREHKVDRELMVDKVLEIHIINHHLNIR